MSKYEDLSVQEILERWETQRQNRILAGRARWYGIDPEVRRKQMSEMGKKAWAKRRGTSHQDTQK